MLSKALIFIRGNKSFQSASSEWSL